MSGRHHGFISFDTFIQIVLKDCASIQRQFQSKATEICEQVEDRIEQLGGNSTLTMCICPPIPALSVEADKQTSTPK